MNSDPIQKFYESHRNLYEFLLEKGEVTFAAEVNNNFRRNLILAIASYFEAEVTSIIREITRSRANGDQIIAAMIEQKFIKRQYHTYFRWDPSEAGPFWNLFGESFKAVAQKKMKELPELTDAVKAFLDLGQKRNAIIHGNYILYDVNDAPEDIMSQYKKVPPFLAFLREHLFSSD